jgi:hypothetical protein
LSHSQATDSVTYTGQQLRLSVTLSGDETAKGECKYDLWRYEIDCPLKEGAHIEETIHHVIRRSLKGEAARALKRMKVGSSVREILDKFDGIYGFVEAGEETLAEFYAAKQGKDEDVSTWGCRLEMLDRASAAGVVSDKDTNEILRKRFWMGLQLHLKEAARHKYDGIDDFDRLHDVVRLIEHEYKKDEDIDK